MTVTFLVLTAAFVFFTFLIFIALIVNNHYTKKQFKKMASLRRDQDMTDIKIAQVLEAFNQCRDSNKTMEEEMKTLNSNLEKFVNQLNSTKK
ncbi:MAG TPA: hypothetical protein QF753_18130 [Victivallales bacterium]|nr:hypothetical protein [Victivallales bacterium]